MARFVPQPALGSRLRTGTQALRWSLSRAACFGVLGLLLCAIGACGNDDAADGDRTRTSDTEPMRVVVTIAPLKGLVTPVLPEGTRVDVLIPPGRSVHGYQLAPSDVRSLGEADLIVSVGLGLEEGLSKYLERVGASRSVVFAETVGLGDAHADCTDGSHAHDDEDEHEHGVDPHLWLDPVLCERFVRAVGEAVATRTGEDPAAGFDARAAARAQAERIAALDDELHAALDPIRGTVIVTQHASFGRFAERYGLHVAEVIRPRGAAEPTAGHIARAAEAVRANAEGGGRVAVFVEPQFPEGVAERVARSAGVPLGRLDPLGDGDWFGLMRQNAAELVRVLGGASEREQAVGDPAASGAGG